ncbi:2Fe-2S iron-sulfur cluster-binding protein [uncultured Erythrobacter sp.]|uniref:2Fe-2S iron-sulfur cluster-binding protein n=1 Tax=uncultured Erythrobacter sp. TaxID=263913 RepID=UPI0026042527|nr:2Fe-2S iron-sulfur cluster-binding protein [uncultured Erythrobacter sp.]
MDGQSGMNLMQLLRLHAVDGITADCSGAMSCGTCRVRVAESWSERLSPPNSSELDMLEALEDHDPLTRLTCQIELTEEIDGLVLNIE